MAADILDDAVGVDDLEEDYGRWLIHGPQGSGKTTLASTIAELGPTLFIDLVGEKGVRSFRGASYAKNIRIKRPRSITELDDIFYRLDKGGHPFKCVILDSLTAAQKMTMRYLLGHSESAVREIKMGTAPASIQTWGQSLDIMSDIATFWYGLADGNRAAPMHVVMTSQTQIAEEAVTKEVMRMPDVQKGARGITLSTPDYVIYTDFEDDPDALADDTQQQVRYIARFGPNPAYRTKGRVPVDLRGKIPAILGRRSPASLASLSRVLGIGGVPAAPAKAPGKAPVAEKEKEVA